MNIRSWLSTTQIKIWLLMSTVSYIVDVGQMAELKSYIKVPLC